MTAETIVEDPKTGGRKGRKIQRFSLIPPDFLWALAKHYGLGALKYDDNNWKLGYDFSANVDALERHLNLWKRGESEYTEKAWAGDRSHHLVAVAWHAIALWWFEHHGAGTDDVRPGGESQG